MDNYKDKKDREEKEGKEEKDGPYEAQLKIIPEHIIYYKDYFAPNLSEFLNISREDNFFQDLSDRVLAENPEIGLTEPDYNVLMYLDGEFRDKEIHYRFCDAVTEYGKNNEEYQFAKVDAFTALAVPHKGSYEKLGEAHAYAKLWMAKNGYEQVGFPRDSAIDGCWNKDSTEDYLTEVQIPVKKKGR